MAASLANFDIYNDVRASRLLGIVLNSANMEKLLSKLHKKPRRNTYVPLQNSLATVRAPARSYSAGARILAFLVDT